MDGRITPAVKMWWSFETKLLLYGILICQEWVKCGFKDTLQPLMTRKLYRNTINIKQPAWLGNEKFHAAHRAILLAKNYDWYKQFGWAEKPAEKNKEGKWPYVWPV